VYIAAEDVGVNTEFVDWMALETRHVMGGEKVSVGGDPSPYTAQGVVNAMKAALAHNGHKVDFKGLTIAIQGVGNVGTNIARIVSKHGAKCIVADINADNVARCVKQYGATAVAPTEILTTKCDILSPCALGGVIDGQLANQLNTKMVVPGANNVLDDPDEDAVILKSLGVTYVPDFVANAGGVIQLAGLYLGYDDRKLADLIANIERTSLEVLKATETSRSAYEAAVAVAEKRIAEGSKTKATRQAVHA
jgi:leucine dehydrogenase